MDLRNLSAAAREICALLAYGHSIKHGVHGFTPGGEVPLNGTIGEGNQSAVTDDVIKELIAAGVPLETYEHNISEGWKTIIKLNQRERVAKELFHAMLLNAGYKIQTKHFDRKHLDVWSRRDGDYQIGRGPNGSAIMLSKPDIDGVAQESEIIGRFPADVEESEIIEAIANHRLLSAPLSAPAPGM